MERQNSGQGSDDIIGYSDLHRKYKKWFLGLAEPQLKKFAIFAAAIIIILPTIATLLRGFIPQPLQVALAFPAGILLFLYILGLGFFLQRKNPSRLTLKDRFSFNQRLKIAIIVGIAVLGILISLNSVIPYAFGGIIALSLALSAYDFLQRTPQEIEYYEEGIIDPRDEGKEDNSLIANKKSRKTKRNKKEVDDE